MRLIQRRYKVVFGCALLLMAGSTGMAAQQLNEPMTLRWWHPLIAGAGVGALFLIDVPLRDAIQDHRTATLDDIASVTNRFKDPPVFYLSGGSAILLGLVSGHPAVTRTGLQIWTAYGLSSAMMIGTKFVFGRARPSVTPDDPSSFDWMGGGEDAAFPSGSAAVTFSLATIVSDAIDHPAATVILYAGATANSWARLNADRHWLSDVALGALYGIAAAKLVNGRWRIFGLRPPSFLIGPDGRAAVATSLAW